ncbi:hypothetical protein [Actinosynnema sp. NPDC023587]|uniref:hypothetical protein n=1 Tax=Actinosynnema sp. NPDC023587 TaxID=3154695 RepID=UPI0033EDE495
MATIPWYCSREDVMGATDSKFTARDTARVDRAVAASSRGIELTLHRKFYPWTGTRTFDWPNDQHGTSWRLWLNQHELVSVSGIVTGGVTLAPAGYLLRPDAGPPYTRVEINLSGGASFGAGATHQRAISIAGVWGYDADTDPVGSLAVAVSSTTATSITVTDSAAVGVGHILLVGSERMIVTGKRMASTGQTVQAPLAAQQNATTLAVADGSTYAYDEVVLLDSERMLIVDIAGNNLSVRRAWDGSTLAAHTGSTIYAGRALTVERGALGTTAATHLIGAPIARHHVVDPVRQLCIAETINTVHQELAGYARQIGAGETARESYARGLRDLRAEVYAAYGRKARIRAV